MGTDMKNMMGNQTGATYANFKGVMLCTRPVMKEALNIERPYCFRVTPPEQLGLCPSKKLRLNLSHSKKVNEYLMRHKKWIKTFQEEINQKRNDAVDDGLRKELKAERVRAKAKAMRDDIRAGNFDENPKYTNSLYQTKPLRDQQNNQADLVDIMNKDN